MEYKVIIEKRDGIYHAFIPLLPKITAEGASRDLALARAWSEAERYLAQVEVATIEVQHLNARSPQTWIETAGMFKGDEDAMWRHIEEIDAERKRQREAVERELGIADELAAPDPQFPPGSPKAVLRAAADCRIDSSGELYQQYLAEMEAEKQRQREEAEREADAA